MVLNHVKYSLYQYVKCIKISKLFIEGSLRILRRFYIWGYIHDNANTCVHRISEFDAKILNLCTLVLLWYENTRLLLQWSSGLMVHWSNIHVPDCRKCSSILVWIYVSSIKPQILALNSFLLQVSFLPLKKSTVVLSIFMNLFNITVKSWIRCNCLKRWDIQVIDISRVNS